MPSSTCTVNLHICFIILLITNINPTVSIKSWKSKQEKYIMIHIADNSFATSQTYCQQHFKSDLASIHSATDDTDAFDLCTAHVGTASGCRFGLYKPDDDNINDTESTPWQYMDGTSYDYICHDWSGHTEPLSGVCAALFCPNGTCDEWIDITCDQSEDEWAVICNHPTIERSATYSGAAAIVALIIVLALVTFMFILVPLTFHLHHRLCMRTKHTMEEEKHSSFIDPMGNSVHNNEGNGMNHVTIPTATIPEAGGYNHPKDAEAVNSNGFIEGRTDDAIEPETPTIHDPAPDRVPLYSMQSRNGVEQTETPIAIAGGNYLFKINISCGEQRVILDEEVSKHQTIRDVKILYKSQSPEVSNDRDLNDIHFYYKNVLLPGDKTLEQVGIVNDRHLISARLETK